MGTPGAGRKRLPNRERLTAEDDALNQIAREAEARLAAKRAARAEAREIRMKELERQQKEIYQVQKKYYGLDTKWGDIEQWMEDSERYSRRARRNASASDEDERMSVGSRGSLRSHLEYASTYPVAGLESERTKKKNYSKATNGYEEDVYGSSQSRKSSRPSLLYSDALPARSYRASVYEESVYSGSRRYSAPSSRAPSEYSCYLGSGSRASSRASSARASPVIEERPEKDFEKGARTVSSLSAATLASLGGTSSRRGSGDTSISADTEASIREIKDIYELKDQIQDVEGKYMQGLKELKDSLAEVEEKYKKAMVSNAQLDNEKTNFMYQVDTLKDALLELEEQLAESRRQYEEKSKEFEREKHAHSILQFQFMEIKEALKQREEMLAKHGIIPDSDIATNGETSDILDNEGHLDSSRTVPGTTQALKTGGEGMLGKANEVEMKNEILEDVGKREILQNTEHEEHKEESEEEEVQTLHAAENAKAEQMVEERDTLPTVMLPESRFAEPAQSLTEPVSGSTSSNSDSDTDGLRKVTESLGTAVQQPGSTEAEHHDLSARTDENLELGSLQGHQIFETPQEMLCDSGTEQDLGEATPKQEEQEDLKTSHALSDNEMDEESDSTSESSELVSNQAGLPEGAVAGLLREEGNVESSTPEEPQHSEESADNKVANVLEEKFVDCTDGRSDKTAGDRTEEDEVENTVQGQPRETESVGLEGTESHERDVPAESLEKEGGEHQAFIQPASSEDSPSASPEEPSTEGKTEDEISTAEKDGQKEELMEELEKCSGSAETGEQGVASLEAGDCIPEGKGSELQQAQPGTELVREVTIPETHLDLSLLDEKIKESELETGDEAGEGKESRTECVEDLNPKVEIQTSQCSEETAGGTEGEKNVPLEGEVQKVVKQVEGESEEESAVGVTVTTESKASKETQKENEQEVELADHPGGEFASEEGANNSLAQKLVQDENVSEQVELEEGANNSLAQKPVQGENITEQVELEGQAEESLEDDGDAFDFDEESNQILESNEKCDGEKANTQGEESDGANGAVGKTAHMDKAGEGTDKMETKDALTEGEVLQHKKDEPEETWCLQGEALGKTDKEADVEEVEIKVSDSSKVEKLQDQDVLEQDLQSAGIKRAESREDLQAGRRSKGRSRDDCTIS
ncbi:leucine-rich repeat flightless-interacting protein 1 isoform 7-T7 [Cyanocitta cristata]